MASPRRRRTAAGTRVVAGEPQGARRERTTGELAIPPRIFAQASPRSIGGVSLFEAQERINSATVPNFTSPQEIILRAVNRLRDAGFEVLQVAATTINIAGSAETYQRAFNTTIVAEERPVIKELGRETTATFLDSPDTAMPGLISTAGTPFEDIIEGVAIEEPRYFMAPSSFAPLKSYWHLRVPGDVSLACNADRAHRTGITGRGVKVAMVDSGWYKHPYFVGRGYRAAAVVPGPGTVNPLNDESGHGTGESANIFAVAPDVDFMPVKINFVNSIGAFNAAVGLNPDIITCSWGSDKRLGPLSAADQALAAAIAAAVAAGITVIFSSGNGQWGFPGQHPDVISAGGVFMDVDESLRASNYASGFISNIYPNRRSPDLCGLVGMRPKAIYIMLPLEPGDAIDATPWNDPSGRGLQGGTHPNGDETTNNDGWGVFSGTSAAAPQLAGAAALVKQACPALQPAEIRDILMRSARDVTAGNGHPNTGANAAVVGPDTATGTGLVDAHKAVLLAKLRCMGPIVPVQPVQPIVPIRPVQPVQPIQPIQPVQPIVPVQPIQPIQPVQPIVPITPIQPIQPVTPLPPPVQSSQPTQAAGAPQLSGRLSAEDVQALEELVIKGEIELDL